jgi:hypothetical protein
VGRGRGALIRLPATLAAAAVLVTACGAGTASPTPIASTAPSRTDPAGVRACVDVSLSDPNGEPVFLSGRWLGSGDPNALPTPSVFLLRQTNSCLVWVGLSANDGEALGASWIETFSGQIRPADSTVVGVWDDVTGGGRGSATVAIEFVSVGDQYEVELDLLDSTGNIHYTKHWVREEPG